MPLDVERALLELEPDWPPTPDLAVAVRARIAGQGAAPGRRQPHVLRPAGAGTISPWRARLHLPHPALATALAVLLAFAVVMAASPSARSTVLRWLGLEGVQIRRAPPAATPPPVRRGAALGLGSPVTLAQARRAAGFPLPVPATQGPPDAIYLARPPDAGGPRISLIYGPRPGIPRSRISGVGLLITAMRANPFPYIQKTLGGGARVQRLTVAGAPALWLQNAHGFAYATPGGGGGFEPQRLADRTLLVARGGVLLRIEGRITRARAIAIARSAFS
jgi:hypothetical protein